ncbi:hypothetical protein B9Z65_4998 [Elsinoe australis]|uniref:Uncharacterized protein n=1 Tax=Elsinoe australis TaxID=40998 RepID=A0A2P7ZCV6_9PEZI|nr:hypothetical protein B9Z65_4998 [Elsinoe australis]
MADRHRQVGFMGLESGDTEYSEEYDRTLMTFVVWAPGFSLLCVKTVAQSTDTTALDMYWIVTPMGERPTRMTNSMKANLPSTNGMSLRETSKGFSGTLKSVYQLGK